MTYMRYIKLSGSLDPKGIGSNQNIYLENSFYDDGQYYSSIFSVSRPDITA